MRRISWLIFFFIFLALIAFTFLVPPFQKPDEYGHFIRTLSISQGVLFCTKEKNNNIKIGKKYINLYYNTSLNKLTHGRKNKLELNSYLNDLTNPINIPGSGNFKLDILCSHPFISYLPQVLGLKLVSLFNFNAYLDFFFGRFMMSLVAFVWFIILYKKIHPNFKLILLLTFSLPMTLHQVSSYNYDAVNIMLGLTYFTLLINCIRREQTYLFPTLITAILFIISKIVGYEFFIFFLFLIPFSKLAKSKKEYLAKIFIFFILFATIYLIFKLPDYYYLAQLQLNKLVNPTLQLRYIFQNPINFIVVLVLTTLKNMRVYMQGLVGLFGWLEYGLDPVSYFLYGVFFIYAVIRSNLPSTFHLPTSKLILLSLTLLFSYIFIHLLTYLFWTPVGAPIADGVQGRYFIVFVPFTILLLLHIKDKPQFKKLVFVLVLIYLIAAVTASILYRYF